MTGEFDSWNKSFKEMETSLGDSASKILQDSVDFARKHETALITAGVLVVGTVALVKSGAAGELLDLVKPAAVSVEDGAGEALSADAARTVLPRAAPEIIDFARLGEKAQFLKGVDTYVFDLDRTLVPSGEAYAAHSQELTRQLVAHTGLSHDFVASAVSDTVNQLKTPLLEERLDLIKPIQDLYPGVNLNERFPGIAPAVKDAYTAALKPRSDVVELLDTLKADGKTLHVFTGSPPTTTAEKLDASGLSKYFDKVFTGAQNPIEDSRNVVTDASTRSKIVELMKSPKADDSGYRQILSHLNVNARSVMMTGDTNALDIAPAKQAGMHTAQANWIHHDVTHLAIPDLTLESPGDLQRLFAANAH